MKNSHYPELCRTSQGFSEALWRKPRIRLRLLRAKWAQTGIATKGIDTNFDSATNAALHLAAQKDAASLPGYTGKISCD
jgi:hypothetical protein